MNIDQAFPSDYFRACDFDESNKSLTISKVTKEDLQIPRTSKKVRKAVVHFKGEDKMLALNKTNAAIIKKVCGKYTEDWSGAELTLYKGTDKYQGEDVDCVRIKNVRKSKVAPKREADKPKPAPSDKQLEQVLAALTNVSSLEAVDGVLKDFRKLAWSDEQATKIAAAKNKKINEIGATNK